MKTLTKLSKIWVSRTKKILKDNSGFELLQAAALAVIALVIGALVLNSLNVTFKDILSLISTKLNAMYV